MKQKLKRTMWIVLALVMIAISLPLNTTTVYATGDVAIDETNFPDETFRQYVRKFDEDNDRALSQSERDNVINIYSNNKGIKSLKGIEYFTNLKLLSCDNNQLTEIDLSQNKALKTLFCGRNQLTKIDLSQNPALEYFNCSVNQLTEIDLSKNPALQTLSISNNQIKKIDLSQNPNLQYLYCHNNQLTEIDLSQNPGLVYLACVGNQLKELDLSKNAALRNLYCNNTQLTELDLSQNPELERLECNNTQLKELDLSQNPKLEVLYCHNNQLTELDLSQNEALEDLNCEGNQLTTLKLSNTPLSWKHLNQKYNISVPKGNSILDFPAGFDASKIQGAATGLTVTADGVEWNEQTSPITFKYKLCDNPEEIVDITVELTEAPNPALEAATELVKKAEADKTEENYKAAKEAVDALVKGSGKTGLEERLKVVREYLDKLLKEAKDKALEEIGKLPNLTDEEKAPFIKRVNDATTIPEVEKALEDAKNADAAKLKDAQDKAKEEIGKLPNLTDEEKAPFIKQVDDATTIPEVKKVVEDAKNADDLKAYKEKAKEEIGNLPNLTEDEKKDFKGQVDTKTDKPGVDEVVKAAKAKDAENKDLADYKEKAKEEIGNLPNLTDEEKKDFKGQVDTKTDKPGVDEVVKAAKAKDAENKDLADYKEKAKEEIGNLPNLTDEEKKDFKDKVDVQTDKPGVDKVVDEAKKKDQENKDKKDLDAYKEEAKKEIDKLPNLTEDEKKDFKGQVDVQTDKPGVDKVVEEARKIDQENKDKKDLGAYKEEAKKEIDKLPNLTDEEKKDFKDKVDVQTDKPGVDKVVEDAKKKNAENGGGTVVPTPTPTPTPTPKPDYNYREIYFALPLASAQKTPETKKKVTIETIITIGSKKLIKKIDGIASETEMDVAAYIKDDRTYIPLRFVGEALGYEVTWDEANRTAILKNKDKEVKLAVDSNVFYVNGERFESDVKPMIKNSRTMIPVGNFARAIGLQDGKDIFWDGATRVVTIKQEIEY